MDDALIDRKARKGKWQLTRFKPKVVGGQPTSNLELGRRQKDGSWKNDHIRLLFDDNLESLKDLLNEWFVVSKK